MKSKKFNILLFIFLLTFISICFIYSKYQNKENFSIDDKKISFEYFLRYKEFYKKINSLEHILDCNIVDEIVKNHVFFKIAEKEGIDVSDRSIMFYFNIHKNDITIDLKEIEKSFKEKDFFEFFIKPFVVKNLLIDKIKYDSTFIQKERYLYSKIILEEWDVKTIDKNFLNEFTEYIEQNLEEKDNENNIESGKKNFAEDDGFYYVFSRTQNVLFGYRIYKITSNEYLETKYQNSFKLKFSNDKDKRAFILINKDKLLGKIVEVK